MSERNPIDDAATRKRIHSMLIKIWIWRLLLNPWEARGWKSKLPFELTVLRFSWDELYTPQHPMRAMSLVRAHTAGSCTVACDTGPVVTHDRKKHGRQKQSLWHAAWLGGLKLTHPSDDMLNTIFESNRSVKFGLLENYIQVRCYSIYL